MKTAQNIGIDYSMGLSNIDRETGIRYGVIAQNSVNPDAWSDAEAIYPDPACPNCGVSAVEIPTHTESSDPPGQWVSVVRDTPAGYEEFEGSGDYACENCRQLFDGSDGLPDEPIGYKYEADGYKLSDCLDSDIFVLGSPYFTFAQFCSPCVPGAGNLDNPTDEGMGAKCYALGHDWFEDGKAPYRLWRVADGTEVLAEAV